MLFTTTIIFYQLDNAYYILSTFLRTVLCKLGIEILQLCIPSIATDAFDCVEIVAETWKLQLAEEFIGTGKRSVGGGPGTREVERKSNIKAAPLLSPEICLKE